MCILLCSVCKAVHEEVCFLFVVKPVGKVAFSVEVFVSARKDKARGVGLSCMRAVYEQDGVRLE